MAERETEHIHKDVHVSTRDGSKLSSCPNCDHFLKESDINKASQTVQCSNCNYIFSIEDGIAFHDGAYSRPEMLMPEGLEVLKLREELEVRVPWRRNQAKGNFAFTVTFTALWNLVLLPFIIIAIATGQWGILGFTALHLVVGIFMLIRTLALFVNTSVLTITRRHLQVRSKPLPTLFPKARNIPVSDIRQLYVTKYVAGRTNNKPHYAYGLYALLSHGRKIKLLRGMNLETQRYLEYEIESFLHLEDQAVDGEHPK